MIKSLLPPSSSPLERALEQVYASRLASIERDIKNLWSPVRCRLDLLPYLAWALSVDYWNDAWPESVKRSVVASSINVHRHKGTLFAVEAALAGLNVDTEVTEWFEYGGSVATAKLSAWVNNNLVEDDSILNEQVIRQIEQAVNYSKRESVHFELDVGLQNTGGLALAGAGIGHGHADMHFISSGLHPESATLSLGLAGGICATGHMDMYFKGAYTDVDSSLSLALAAGLISHGHLETHFTGRYQ